MVSMSRGDFGEVGYRPTATRDGDSEYIRLSNCVSNNIQQMTKNVASIQMLVSQLGTQQDVPEHFDDLQNKQKETSQLAKGTSIYLKQLGQLDGGSPQEQRQRKIQQEKLRENFSNVLNNFQKAQRLAAEKEKASVQRARVSSFGEFSPERNEFSQFQEEQRYGSMGAPQMQLQTESELSLDMIKEREGAIRQLETDILDVNEIFKDLALMVHEQGEMVDSIEAHVDTAAVHVEEGNVQLEKAKEYQKASRRKLCCLAIILVLVAGIIGIIIYVTTKK